MSNLDYDSMLIVTSIVIFDFIEFEIKQAASDFWRIRSARSRSFSSLMFMVGSRITTVIKYFPSTLSSTPLDLQPKPVNSNFEFSAIAKKVVIKQLLTEAVKRCSGDQILGIPFGNSGGVATSMQFAECELPSANSGEHIIPFRSSRQVKIGRAYV